MVSKDIFGALPRGNGDGLVLEHPNGCAAASGSDSRLPHAALLVEVDALCAACVVLRSALVSRVDDLICRPEIAESVIFANPVDVVDLRRVGSMLHDPDNSRHGQVLIVEPDLKVAVAATMADGLSGLPVSARLFSGKDSRSLVVVKDAAKVFLARVFDHFLPFVKGLHYVR